MLFQAAMRSSKYLLPLDLNIVPLDPALDSAPRQAAPELIEAAFVAIFRLLRLEKQAGAQLTVLIDERHEALAAVGLAAAQLCFEQGDHFWRITPSGRLMEYGIPARRARQDPFSDNLRKSRQQLRQLSASLQEARETESRRIARQIHDNLGAALTGLKMDIAWINKHIQDPRSLLQARLQSMSELIDQTVDSVRRIATELRPAILDEVGLVPALEWQLREFQSRTGIACSFEGGLENSDLNDAEATAVFRIFQESLTNIARHAHASQVRVAVEENEQSLCLRIADNGRGIRPAEINRQQSLGLLGMQERALMVGGQVRIDGDSQRGTCVTIRLPRRSARELA
jgi:signal transduction histidine kinase